MPLTFSVDTAHIIVRLGKFDPCLTVSFAASIVFPQALVWYAYPIILVISFWSSWLLNVLGCFLFWLRNVITRIPVFKIIIRATITRWQQNLEPLHEVEAIEWYHHQSQEPGSNDGVLDAAIEVTLSSKSATTHELNLNQPCIFLLTVQIVLFEHSSLSLSLLSSMTRAGSELWVAQTRLMVAPLLLNIK